MTNKHTGTKCDIYSKTGELIAEQCECKRCNPRRDAVSDLIADWVQRTELRMMNRPITENDLYDLDGAITSLIKSQNTELQDRLEWLKTESGCIEDLIAIVDEARQKGRAEAMSDIMFEIKTEQRGRNGILLYAETEYNKLKGVKMTTKKSDWNGYDVTDLRDNVTISKTELAALKGKAADFMKLEAENARLYQENGSLTSEVGRLKQELKGLKEKRK